MILTEIPQAAGITGILTAAGLTSGEVHEWFHRARPELAGLTPALALMTVNGRGAGQLVLAVARADASELRDTGCLVLGRGLPKHAWEGSD